MIPTGYDSHRDYYKCVLPICRLPTKKWQEDDDFAQQFQQANRFKRPIAHDDENPYQNGPRPNKPPVSLRKKKLQHRESGVQIGSTPATPAKGMAEDINGTSSWSDAKRRSREGPTD